MEDERNEIDLMAQKHWMQDAGRMLMQGGLKMASGGFWGRMGMVNGLPVNLPRLGSNTARYFSRASSTYQRLLRKYLTALMLSLSAELRQRNASTTAADGILEVPYRGVGVVKYR